MKRFVITAVVCLLVAACSGTPPAQQQAHPTGITTSGAGLTSKVNKIRMKANRSGVTRSATLDAAAHAHATDMARRNFFDHKGSNGSTVGKRVTKAGYRWCYVAENIAKGQKSEAAALEEWRASSWHYRNIVSRHSREFGLANIGDIWVMVLAGKNC